MNIDYPGEIFSRRNLIWELIVRELKIRYSRPLLGFLWAFLSPILSVTVFYMIFSLFLKVQIEEAPFLLYLMTAVFPWRFFQESLTASATSLVDNRNLIREANFPHYLVPVSIVLANMINFLPSLFIVIVISSLALGGLPLYIFFLPLVLLTHVLAATGLSIIFSVAYVRWRDIKFILEPALMLLFYLIPGVYSLRMARDALPAGAFTAYTLNPLVGLSSLYRISILRGFYPLAKEDLSAAAIIAAPAAFALIVFFLAFHIYSNNRSRINDYLSH